MIQSSSPSEKIQIMGRKGVKVKLKHCWLFVVNKLLNAKCFAFTPQANFPAHNLNFHWRWMWLGPMQATFLNIFYSKYECIFGEESLAICSRLVFGKTKQISFEWGKQSKMKKMVIKYHNSLTNYQSLAHLFSNRQ